MRLFGTSVVWLVVMTSVWMELDAFTAPHVAVNSKSKVVTTTTTSLQGVRNPPPDALTPFKALVRTNYLICVVMYISIKICTL